MSVLGPDGMQAGWLDAPQGQLFACYHPPRGSKRRGVTILLCDPFGSDRMNLHLTYRALALELSAVGFPVLRVDYPGTCDSSGYPRKSARLDTWLGSLDFAADWLKETSGKQELATFGALLGGTLALAFSARRPDVKAVAVWGAYHSGHAFVREARALASMTKSDAESRRRSDFETGDTETIGFLLNRDFADELCDLDVGKLKTLQGLRVGVFPRNRSASEDRLVAQLKNAGAEVTPPPPAVVDIANVGGDGDQPPCQLISQIVAWYQNAYPGNEGPPVLPQVVDNIRLRTSVAVANHRGIDVTEGFIRCGPDGGVTAIVAQPLQAQRNLGIVVVNGGTNHRPGINRNTTEWVRDWAERGFLCVRLDIRGLGDSPPDKPEDIARLYRDETRRDISTVLDAVTERYGVGLFAVGGTCAGGYQAFHCALEDSRISGLFMIHPLRFAREQRIVASEERGELDYAPLSYYRRALLDHERWARMLRGSTDVLGVSRSIAQRLMRRARQRFKSLGARILRKEPASGTTWLSRSMFDLCERGCRVLIVFNEGSEFRGRFEEELQDDRRPLLSSGLFAVELIEQTDHIMTPLWSQAHVGALLEEYFVAWAEDSLRKS